MENLVTKYKKIKVFDNLYLYKFVDIIEDVEYDYYEQCVYYNKKGTKKCLYEIENIYFTVSDDKYCFSEYLEKEQLIEIYETEDDEEIKKLLIDDCKRTIKFSVFDDETEVIKLINSDSEKINKAKPDSYFCEYYLSAATDYNTILSMPEETVDSLLSQLEKNNIKDVINLLNNIKVSAEQARQIAAGNNINQKEEEIETEEIQKEDQISKLLEQLNLLIGLKNVKEIVEQLIAYLDYINRTKETQNLEIPNLHMVFKGNPGTGKTTVARIIAKLLHYLGYVSKDKFVEITAQDLIAGYVGQTAIKTKKLIDDNKGGVIFLDEAYIMCNQTDSFAEEALVEILKEMETKDTVFIFAGYQKEMTNFIDMNPGFSSRIGSVIEFGDYSLEELFEMLNQKLNKHNLVLEDSAKEKIESIIEKKKNKENFGNGRYINHIFDKIIMNHALNCRGIDDLETLKVISIDDIKDIEEKTKEKAIGFKI